MIRITVISTTYPAPRDDEEDYCPDPSNVAVDEYEISFRDLVAKMRHEYTQPSCWPASGDRHEWLSVPDSDVDLFTGDITEHSLHYGLTNPARNDKYWTRAMRAAGLVRN